MSLTPTLAGSVMAQALAAPLVEGDATDDAIMDATLRCVGRYGLDRMTMGDVASLAGVGRATVFRRFTSKEVLLHRTVARELVVIADQFHAATKSIDDPLERLIEFAVEAARVVRTHPLAVRLFDDDAALPLLRDLQIAALLLDGARNEVAAAARQAPASVDVEAVAELLVRFWASIWVAPSLGDYSDASDRRMVRALLASLAPTTSPATTAVERTRRSGRS
jgi:AcrR family transcriptional regulator